MATPRRIAFATTTLLATTYAYTSLRTPISATSIPSPPSSTSSPASHSTSTSLPATASETQHRARSYDGDRPKPVEDRHGDTVLKHSIAAEKNQREIRRGKFSGEEFNNVDLKHTADPCNDFEDVKEGGEGKGK